MSQSSVRRRQRCPFASKLSQSKTSSTSCLQWQVVEHEVFVSLGDLSEAEVIKSLALLLEKRARVCDPSEPRD